MTNIPQARERMTKALICRSNLRSDSFQRQRTQKFRKDFVRFGTCVKLSYNVRATLTISLPQKLRLSVTRTAKSLGLSESEFVRRAVQQQLWEEAFEETRRVLVPKARAQGIYTDEDVFNVVS